MVLKLATTVSTWPFYNFRYRKLLFELAKRFSLYVIAGSTLPGGDKVGVFKLITVLPFKLPRRIRYFVSPPLAETALNIVDVDPDIMWLFDTATPVLPILSRAPIVLDTDDPKVVLPREMLSRTPKLSLVNELRLLKNKKVKKIVVPTAMIKNKFIKLGIDGQKIEVIPNGVDTGIFTQTPLPKDPVVLYYGTFQLHRARLLLKVVEAVARKRRDARFLLIGHIPPPVRDGLRRVAGSRCDMPGFIEHDRLAQYIQKSRVCIFPQDRSLGGRLPSKLLDYFASGRPVVATNVDESFPVMESGAGIITDINPEAMAEAIIRLLDDDGLANQLACKGVEYVRKYDWNKIVEDYVRLFHHVIYER